MRIAVLGANGQVGRQLMVELESAGIEAVGITRDSPDGATRVDLLDRSSVAQALRRAAPTHIVLCAAATNVAWCEANPRASAQINVAGTAAVVDIARSLGAPVTFLSSDYVFDGLNGPYAETATPNPINEYGRQKVAAEQLVLSEPNSMVVRTCQVFGTDQRRANFVLRVADRLRAHLRVEVDARLYGTPTYSVDLTRSLIALLLTDSYGVRHVAGPRLLSRRAFAALVARTIGISDELIVPKELSDGVPRPHRSGLISTSSRHPTLPITDLDLAVAETVAEPR